MNQVLEIDSANLIAVAQPGMGLSELNAAVEKFGLIYPPDPGTFATATLGGTVSENAGNLRGTKYGMAKHYIMGLEAVLADGRVLQTGGKNVKDVAGYDLTKLFTGAQGTLGVITKVIVKLMPAPEARTTILATFGSLDDAGAALACLIAGKLIPAALEIMDSTTVRAVADRTQAGLPDAAAMLLIELDGIPAAVEKDSATVVEILTAHSASDIRTGQDAAAREGLWAVRRAALPALAQLRPAFLLTAASVPRSRVTDMLRAVNAIAAKHDLTVGTFGQAGDGTLYPTIACDRRDAAEMDRVNTAVSQMGAAARELGGWLSGEPNDGPDEVRSGTPDLAAMRALKQALDPNGILSPGKIVGRC
jgi:glycolate oxidase